jgi:hypothetical protein
MRVLNASSSNYVNQESLPLLTHAIPNRFIFVWDDKFFPYTAYLAIKAVANRARPNEIHLLRVAALDGVENFERLRREVACLRPVTIDLPGWLEEARLPCAKELLAANDFLKQRNFYGSVSDMLRTLYLYLHGGVYLDTDTLALRPFSPLLGSGGFVAEEHILVDSKTYKRNSRWRYLRTAPLTVLRDLCSRVSWGVGLFQLLAPLYTRAIHNATMGFRPRHPLTWDVLLRMAERYPDRPKRYPLLGPDTLQDLVAEKQYSDVVVLPPSCFSPLGPTMTYQYFHKRSPRTIEGVERRLVGETTYAIHWSNNGTIAKAVPKNDDDLRAMKDFHLFAKLAVQAAFPSGI